MGVKVYLYHIHSIKKHVDIGRTYGDASRMSYGFMVFCSKLLHIYILSIRIFIENF